MFMRVVRFTDVPKDRIDGMLGRVEDSGGPPKGVPAKGLQVIYDEDQQTAVVLQHFESREDMEEGARVLEGMDPGETPGTRASVDAGEVRADVTVSR